MPSWQIISVAVLAAIFVWWFSTGIIFWLVRRHPATYKASFVVTTGLALVATAAIPWIGQYETVAFAYTGFLAAIVLWGWHEMSFLMGFITGKADLQAPIRSGIWHFKDAAMAVIYHEIAIAITAGLLVWLSWGLPNKVALWTYLILWLMRLSAKLNIFLGVPNLNAELLPSHLRFLRNYFSERPLNFLFPFSIIIPTVIAGAMLGHLATAEPIPFALTGHSLLGTLLALAILEHWFLVLPVSDSALWRWAIGTAGDNKRRLGKSDFIGSAHKRGLTGGSGVPPVPAYQLPSSEGNRP